MQRATYMIPYSDAPTVNSRGRLSTQRAIESFLDPILIVAVLVLVAHITGANFGKRYLLVALVAFSANFPGRPFLVQSYRLLVRNTFVDWLGFAAMLLLFAYASHYVAYFPRQLVLEWVVVTPVVLVAAKLTVRELLPNFLAQRGRFHSAVIVGCNPPGTRLASNFAKNPCFGIKCLGFFDDRSRQRLGHVDPPLLGTFADVTNYVQQVHVEHIYLALPMASQPRVLKILNGLKDTTASIYFVPDIYITDFIQGWVDYVAGIPVVSVCETPFRGINRLAKRLLDIALSVSLLAALSPLLILTAIAVKVSSTGPVMFKQRRYGLSGEEIIVYKFRTMTVTEDGNCNYTQVTRNDLRVTAVGAVLRRLSLDELPQLFNVLQGTMSVVGPRPHAVAVNEQYRRLIPGYMVRHKVKPGITGWAQVHGYRGGDDLESMTKRVHYDLEYLRQWSIWLDIQILFRTVGLVLGGDRHAY